MDQVVRSRFEVRFRRFPSRLGHTSMYVLLREISGLDFHDGGWVGVFDSLLDQHLPARNASEAESIPDISLKW